MRIRFDESKRPFFAQALRATVGISCKASVGWPMTGTGIVLSRDGVILTAYHVVTNSRTVQVCRLVLNKKGWTVRRYGRYIADVLYVDKRADLAIIKLRKPLACLEPALLGDSDAVSTGTPVFRVGCDVDCQRLAEGYAFAFVGNVEGMPRIYASMHTDGGASGGPLITADGHVIGVVLWGVGDPKEAHYCGALPINAAKRRLFWRRVVKDLFPEGLPE